MSFLWRHVANALLLALGAPALLVARFIFPAHRRQTPAWVVVPESVESRPSDRHSVAQSHAAAVAFLPATLDFVALVVEASTRVQDIARWTMGDDDIRVGRDVAISFVSRLVFRFPSGNRIVSSHTEDWLGHPKMGCTWRKTKRRFQNTYNLCPLFLL